MRENDINHMQGSNGFLCKSVSQLSQFPVMEEESFKSDIFSLTSSGAKLRYLKSFPRLAL